ncbi:MAG: hypothetical protein JXQ72_02020 [Anaerolineae bacterium]|nr:hypothetical protein [Anaerolineae bacterium]
MAVWTIGDFKLDGEQVAEVLAGIARADAARQDVGPLDVAAGLDYVDSSRLPVDEGRRGNIQKKRLLKAFFPLLAEAGLATLLEGDEPQIILNDPVRQWFAYYEADPYGAEVRLEALLSGESGTADTAAEIEDGTVVEEHDISAPVGNTSDDLWVSVPDDETVEDEHETPGEYSEMPEPENPYRSEEDDRLPSASLPGVLGGSMLGSTRDRSTEQREKRDIKAIFSRRGSERRVTDASPPPDRAADENDWPPDQAEDEPYPAQSSDENYELSGPVDGGDEPPPVLDSFSQGRDVSKRRDRSPAAHLGNSRPKPPASKPAEEVRRTDQEETRGPRGGGWLDRLRSGSTSPKPASKPDDEPRGHTPGRRLTTPEPGDSSPAHPFRLTDGPADLRPRGPRARQPQAGASQSASRADEVVMLPLILPDGSQMKIARRDLDRLIEEHGTLSAAITFLAATLHYDVRDDVHDTDSGSNGEDGINE